MNVSRRKSVIVPLRAIALTQIALCSLMARPGHAAADTPPLPLDHSAIVHRNQSGGLVVASASGKAIDGIKLSKHDFAINNPWIIVAPNGAIHVAFVEQSQSGFAVYHRASTDGGRTWTEAKNLSEVMPGYNIGNCQIAADGAGRIYVIWRTGASPRFAPGAGPSDGGPGSNLVYRVLDGGAWSGNTTFVNTPATEQALDLGTASWFASTDPTGTVHVIWSMWPDHYHPDLLYKTVAGGVHRPGIAKGLLMETTLNGNAAAAPHEIYMAKVFDDARHSYPFCDNFDELNGYVDSAGQVHCVTEVVTRSINPDSAHRFQIIESGTQKPGVVLPGPAYQYWAYPPRLLVDAQGRRHIITMYPSGEQQNVRDYVLGSDAEPTVIRAAKDITGTLMGVQAFQGPDGRMIALMQMNDTGKPSDSELYVSVSSGGAWSAPVNVTNNAGRVSFVTSNTSSRSHVAELAFYYPGPAAATFDKSGHLVLAFVSIRKGIVDSSALGVTIGGGSVATPNLLFLRF